MSGTPRPLGYAAKDSHARYPRPDTYPFQQVLTQSTPYRGLHVDLIDVVAAGGPTFAAWHSAGCAVVSSDVEGQLATERGWLARDGR